MLIPVALKKVTELAKHRDFIAFQTITDTHVNMIFKTQVCKVSNFGKVEWIENKSN